MGNRRGTSNRPVAECARKLTMEYALQFSPQECSRYRLMAATARVEEAAIWSAAGIGPAAVVADIGCGPGAVLRLLAEQVGPAGRAQGVDCDAEAVTAAAEEVGDLDQASVRQGEAIASGLEPGSFDVVMCRHVLAHNGGQEEAIVAHLTPLARPGGAVCLVDADMTAIWMVPRAPDLEDLHARYIAYQQTRGNDMIIGRSLGLLLEAAGLTVEVLRFGAPAIRPQAGFRPPAWAARAALMSAGAATHDDIVRWDAAFARRDASPVRPWRSMPICLAVGRKGFFHR